MENDEVISSVAGTIDLAPTFERWAGLARDTRRDGRPLTPLLHGRTVAGWRRALLIEHSDAGVRIGDPDGQGWAQGKPSSYAALRTRWTTYVEYDNGDREFYNRRRDPYELHNRAGRLSHAQLKRFSDALAAYRRCAGASACQAAGEI